MTGLENKMWEARLKQKDIAKMLGKSPAAICEHVKKGIKTMRVARQYAKVLKCDPKELLD